MRDLIFIAKLSFIFIIFLISSCENNDDNDTPPDFGIEPPTFEQAVLCRKWEVESFLINNQENILSLQQDSCYMPIYFVYKNYSHFYGLYNTLDCTLNGSYYVNNTKDSLALNFFYSGFIGLGPWGSQQFQLWKVLEFNVTRIKLECDFQNSHYSVTLKSF